MRLTELFEDDTPSAQEWLEAWTAVEQDLRDVHDGQTVAKIKNHAHRKYFQVGRKIDATGAIERAEGAVTNKNTIAQKKADRMAQRNKENQPKKAQSQPTRDKVKPSITTPDADRTRKDALGRNLKADRYYNQLNKSQRGRDIIKKVSQKLGLPPEADEVIDYIADTMPTVIQKLDNLIANPANIGGALNPRNRRK